MEERRRNNPVTGRRKLMSISEINEKDLTTEQKIMINLTSVNTAVNTLQETVGKHHKLLVEGNGDIPLLEKVRNMEAFVKEFRYWSRFVFGAIILQTLAFAAGIIIALIRFLPLLEGLAHK